MKLQTLQLQGMTKPAGLAQVMMDFLQEWEQKLGIKITCSQVHHLPLL